MEMVIIAEVSILTFMAGFALGVTIKGMIDTKFDKAVQKSLIRIGQMADDEIEEKDKTIKKKNNELNERNKEINEKNKEINDLKEAIKDLQFEKAINKLDDLKGFDL